MAKGGNASTTFTGSPETFQHDSIGTFTDSSFPAGWSDMAQVTSHSTAPQPSAVVIETADAFGHLTKALATLPNVALSQGIYRPIEPSDFYMTRADVRVDQFSDVDPAVAVEDPNNPGFLLLGSRVPWTGRWGLPSPLSTVALTLPIRLLPAFSRRQRPILGIFFQAPPTLSSTSTSVSKSKKANGTALRPISTPRMALCTVR